MKKQFTIFLLGYYLISYAQVEVTSFIVPDVVSKGNISVIKAVEINIVSNTEIFTAGLGECRVINSQKNHQYR